MNTNALFQADVPEDNGPVVSDSVFNPTQSPITTDRPVPDRTNVKDQNSTPKDKGEHP